MGRSPLETIANVDDEQSPTRPNQRQRILDAALHLMSEQGAGSTSMRQLARACDVNVATIYHYFPSKADLLRSVIEDRQYHMRLRLLPTIEARGEPVDELTALIEELWLGAMAEEPIWRLLLGESLRGDETALAVGAELLGTIEEALRAWLTTRFVELGDRVPAAAAVISGQLYSSFMERLFMPDQDVEVVRERARMLAALIVST